MKLLLTVALLSILVSGLAFAQSGAPSCGAPKNAAEQRPPGDHNNAKRLAAFQYRPGRELQGFCPY